MIEHLTKDTFKTKIFDFEKSEEWQYSGDLPCLIDFYTTWCGPCKSVAPILEELASEYQGKMHIYKVDAEAEQQLSLQFNITTVPSLLFVPLQGKPQMAVGVLPKKALQDKFAAILNVQPPTPEKN